MALKTHWLGSLASKVILCNTKITVGMKLLEMGKDMKIKHSISFPLKCRGTFFFKKLWMKEQTFLGKFIRVVLHGE